MADLFAASDIVCLTSRWEGVPRVLVQARAAGRPVVATSVNGVPEVIAHGVQGLLVEAGDIAGIAGALVRLAGDTELRARLGAASTPGLEEFDQEAMVDQQEKLYRTLLTTRGDRLAAAPPPAGLDPAARRS